ncbi:MAG: GDCCVxC domain-containing (seleno)protein [Paracoccaceae bacterium]
MTKAFASTITCPACGHRHAVTVPTDRCELAHDCPACGVELRREPGSCCVYCAHGARPPEGSAAPAS